MSQQYTEVEWQDPAGGNPGTLINKARLDQMQTAHHYADGLEEVDAVPTADPGVSYHKIVYCTADDTIYRWNGTEWTADIDDPTRELLEEHEADHANPHQVTKAQVGLGNADNTSDMDKPVSTATQTALATKANTADVYDKLDVDALLAGKADSANVYTHAEMDNLLAGKVDKLVSSPAGTYKSVTVNAQGQVTAGTNPTTLAGYGITDAYTKTEADTLLAGKASTTAVQTLDTRVGALEAGKVGISEGVTPWSASVTYSANAFCAVNGTLYRSLSAGNLGHNPLSSADWWEEYSPGSKQSTGLIGPDNLYTADIGDGTSTVLAVNHGLTSFDILWAIWDGTNKAVTGVKAVKTSADILTLTFAEAPAVGQYRILVFRPGDSARIYTRTFAPTSNEVVINHNLGRLPSGISLYAPDGTRVGVRMTVDTMTATLHLAGYDAGNYTIQVIA